MYMLKKKTFNLSHNMAHIIVYKTVDSFLSDRTDQQRVNKP